MYFIPRVIIALAALAQKTSTLDIKMHFNTLSFNTNIILWISYQYTAITDDFLKQFKSFNFLRSLVDILS